MLKKVKDNALKIRNWLQRRHLTHAQRTTPNYKDAKTVGVFWCLGEEDGSDAVKRLVQQLKKDGKHVDAICFTNSLPDATLGFDCIWLTYNDISLHGTIEHTELSRFLETPFDFLYSIPAPDGLGLMEWVMGSSHARCRVGPHIEGKHHLFELMIYLGPSASTSDLVEQMLHFTKGIKHNH